MEEIVKVLMDKAFKAWNDDSGWFLGYHIWDELDELEKQSVDLGELVLHLVRTHNYSPQEVGFNNWISGGLVQNFSSWNEMFYDIAWHYLSRVILELHPEMKDEDRKRMPFYRGTMQ